MKAHPAKTIEFIRGKNAVGGASKADVAKLLQHIDALENLLEHDDGDDVHGTEGWRHYLSID